MFSGRVHIAKAPQASQIVKSPKKTLGRKRWGIAVAALLLSMGASSTRAAEFFDWLGEPTNPNPVPTYVTAPTLNDANAAAVDAYLAAQQSAGKPLAVKVRAGTILGPASMGIYNKYNVQYTFADYEGVSAVTQATTLVNQIKASTVTGPAVNAGSSYIGNYQIAPFPNDPTRPAGASSTSGNGSGFDGVSGQNPFYNTTDFRATGLNMANEQLYPGDPSFRNPLAGNSTAPNIRSAFFTLPIQRLSIITNNIGAGQPNIPYISRFNNWSSTTFKTPGLFANDIYGKPTPAWQAPGTGTAGQLLSRNDFQALTLHYKMRGANGFELLDPGVAGYTQLQEEQDAQAGWTNSLVDGVMNHDHGRVAILPNTVNIDGLPLPKTNEDAGVVYSAVTNDSTSSPGLALLVSNMSDADHTVSFNTRINGASLVYSKNFGAGTHTILRFTKLPGGGWNSTPIIDPAFNATGDMAARDGIGIPEPASISLLGIGALGILARRRRKA